MQMKQNIIEFNSLAIQRFRTNDDSIIKDEGIKYHYTSPDAFLSIVNNKSLRFTDIRYMNDKSEKIYFIKILLDYLQENKGRFPNAEAVVNELLKENDRQSIQNLETSSIKFLEIKGFPYTTPRAFVLCTCNDADALNMWNYYVQNGFYRGFSIGFKIQNLIKAFDTPKKSTMDPFLVFYGDVLYSPKKQKQEIANLLRKIDKYVSKSTDNRINEIRFKFAMLNLRNYIDTCGAFYKSSKFAQEKEYRIVVDISQERLDSEKDRFYGVRNKKLKEDYCTKNGLIVPYLNVEIPEDAISRVYLSPMAEYEILHDSVKGLLKKNGFENFRIYKSKIPIRF